jgi:hypothetical protein
MSDAAMKTVALLAFAAASIALTPSIARADVSRSELPGLAYEPPPEKYPSIQLKVSTGVTGFIGGSAINGGYTDGHAHDLTRSAIAGRTPSEVFAAGSVLGLQAGANFVDGMAFTLSWEHINWGGTDTFVDASKPTSSDLFLFGLDTRMSSSPIALTFQYQVGGGTLSNDMREGKLDLAAMVMRLGLGVTFRAQWAPWLEIEPRTTLGMYMITSQQIDANDLNDFGSLTWFTASAEIRLTARL